MIDVALGINASGHQLVQDTRSVVVFLSTKNNSSHQFEIDEDSTHARTTPRSNTKISVSGGYQSIVHQTPGFTSNPFVHESRQLNGQACILEGSAKNISTLPLFCPVTRDAALFLKHRAEERVIT